jgi:hypothetical protein
MQLTVHHNTCFRPLHQQANQTFIPDAVLEDSLQPFVIDGVVERLDTLPTTATTHGRYRFSDEAMYSVGNRSTS